MIRSGGSDRAPMPQVTVPARPVEVKLPRDDAPLDPVPAGRPKGGGQVRLPVYGLYIAVTVVLAAVILTWAIGFQIGKRRGEDAALKQLGVGPSPLVKRNDPTNPNGSGAPDKPQVQPQTPKVPEDAPEPRVERPVPSGAIIGARGEVVEEPRQAGTNYLKLASRMSAEEAQAAVGFLVQNGVQAIGVRVDGTGTGANNPARYDLFSLFGVPSSRYSQMEAERDQHWQLVQRLGREWQTKHKGSVNFASPQWVLFRG